MGQRYRDYLSQPASAKNAGPLNFKIEGIDETIAAFERIRDEAMRDRKVVGVIRRVVSRYYLPVIRSLAAHMGPRDRGRKFSESFGLLETMQKPYINRRTKMVTVRAGARTHTRFRGRPFFPDVRGRKKTGGNNYGSGGWLASFWEHGTEDRTKKSGARTGRIKPTKFATLAFKRSQHMVEKKLRGNLKTMMEREFAFASRGMVRKIPKA